MNYGKRTNPFEKYFYLVGTKINNWTVLELRHKRRNVEAYCRCDCGTEKLVNIQYLIQGKSKNCGCGRKKMLRETRTKNLVGQRFGKLVVVELLPKSNKFNRRMYRCKCDCGKEIITSSICLTSGSTKSCGCLVSYYNMYIKQLLDKWGIEYKNEYRIHIDGNLYRFDFYLPKYNLMIEYDGSQHYVPSRWNKDEEKDLEDFRKTQESDKIKNQYCKDNNIDLLRIPYWESKNIDTIIYNRLQRLSDEGLPDINQLSMQQSELQT